MALHGGRRSVVIVRSDYNNNIVMAAVTLAQLEEGNNMIVCLIRVACITVRCVEVAATISDNVTACNLQVVFSILFLGLLTLYDK